MNKKATSHIPHKQGFIVPPEGSLGLLALGDKGLRAWRIARDERKKAAPKK